MSLVTPLDIMDGIEARLRNISGLRVTEYTPDQITPPQAVVGVPPWRRESMRKGVFSFPAFVTIYTSTAYSRVGQRALAEYSDPEGSKSVLQAIETAANGDPDATLGLAGVDCKVMEFEPIGVDEFGVFPYFGGRFTLLVTVTAT